MLKKFAFATLAVALIAGCASTPRDGAAQAVAGAHAFQIQGSLVDLTDVKIFVNGDKVIDEQVSLLRGDGEFRGSYGGRPVTASCSTAPARREPGTTCLVSVDHGRETTLTF